MLTLFAAIMVPLYYAVMTYCPSFATIYYCVATGVLVEILARTLSSSTSSNFPGPPSGKSEHENLPNSPASTSVESAQESLPLMTRSKTEKEQVNDLGNVARVGKELKAL